MLSQFLQLKIINSHSDLQRNPKITDNKIKFSLPNSQNSLKAKSKQNFEEFIHQRKNQKDLLKVDQSTFSGISIESKVSQNKHQKFESTEEYYFSDNKCWKNNISKEKQCELQNKMALILSPKKDMQKRAISPVLKIYRSPLIQSTRNCMRPQSQKDLFTSQQYKPLISQETQVNFINQQINQIEHKERSFRSSSSRNLSPLRNKLNSGLSSKQNLLINSNVRRSTHQNSIQKKGLFLRALIQSKQHNNLFQNFKSQSHLQSKGLNQEYYRKSIQKAIVKPQRQYKKIIKVPTKQIKNAQIIKKVQRIKDVQIIQKVQEFKRPQIKNNFNIFYSFAKNQSSMLDPVNNSLLNGPLPESDSKLNMEPY